VLGVTGPQRVVRLVLVKTNAAGRFLFGLDPRDPRAYAFAMITLLMAAFVATLLPARRAASVEPTKALQQE
jgi:putative ABC transport system permease protein